MTNTSLSRAVAIHRALSHPARLRILAMLRRHELCACQITAILHLAPSTVSAHLKELRAGGLIEERRQGRWIVSRLSSSPGTVPVLERVWEELAGDPVLAEDARLVRELLKVDVQTLCRTGLDLERLGIAAAGAATKNGGVR